MRFKFSVIQISVVMDNIIEPDQTFDFNALSLAHPVGIQGGAYFTKIEYYKKPLYIQTTKSVTRQGFVKTGKRYYCDLMFDKNSETLINWFENLEERCHQLIYAKKDAWFQGNLEQSDIETAFNPLIRVYKSGKYYLLRTNIKNNKEDLPAVKIYNEKEVPLNLHDVTCDTELISIVEIQGIKFTSRNFQIELELKQAMVIDTNPLFESCLIKTKMNRTMTNQKESVPTPLSNDSLEELFLFQEESTTKENMAKDIVNEDKEEDTLLEEGIQIQEDPQIEDSVEIEEGLEIEDDLEIEEVGEREKHPQLEKESLDIDFEELSPNIEENKYELKEMDNAELFPLDKKQETITLKKPNQVYFELYKEARTKAKQAKKNAILAYLEAKNIKKTYMIENIHDSDSDFDAEIDDVSESELEDL
jgi:hypothetical protein